MRKPTKLRKSAQGKECSLNVAGVCNYNTETTVLCHLDSEMKGMSLKSPDHFAVYGCSDCHKWLDSHQGSELDRLYYSLRALGRTHAEMINEGALIIK